MSKLAGVDTYLGPEMKSTGEVMGIDREHPAALAKALMAAGMLPPTDGSLLLSIADRDKPAAEPLVRALTRLGLRLYATEGTARFIRSLGAKDVTVTHRIGRGNPDVVELVRQGAVDAVVNTISGGGLGTMRTASRSAGPPSSGASPASPLSIRRARPWSCWSTREPTTTCGRVTRTWGSPARPAGRGAGTAVGRG